MKTWTETITKREGEWLGPVDYAYDWNQYDIYPNDPEYRMKKVELIKEIEKLFLEGKTIYVFYDPIISGKLLNIGMYDGWPYWKPTPAVLLQHWSGCETHFWSDIQSYRIIETE